MIAHHIDDAMLLEYAAGAASPADALLVATHLTLCPECRSTVAAAEAAGGAMLEPAEADLEHLLDATLARLDEPAPPVLPAPSADPSGVLPLPLASVAGPFAELPWERQFPGIEVVTLDVPHSGMPPRLFRIPAGGFIPRHAHRGEEHSLVLTGGFTDHTGHFERGDVRHCVSGEVHRLDMDPGEPCVVLVVADAPFAPRSFLAGVASLWRGF